MTLTPGSYDDGTAPRSPRRRRGPSALPARLALIGALIVLVLIATSTGSVRDWWARHLGDVTSGSRAADFGIGLVVGLLPLIGVLLGTVRARGPRRLFRMFVFGGAGFVVTYLLAPSPARYLSDHESTRIFQHEVPGYLPGVVTGIAVWVVAVVVGVLRARRWWHRVTRRGPDGPPPRVIDI
ncbi:MAG TPA: hypothetical protein VFJ98_08020 [Mycobacteriales bacterium]|nr:hypothetical protein [Mycobacteriales bacterium]